MIQEKQDSVSVDAQLRETISHGTAQFPLKIYTNVFGNLSNFLIGWHWHPEIEFSIVQRGRVEVCVNNISYILQTGEGILINAKATHMMRPVKEQPDTVIENFVFSPSLLESDTGSDIYRKYIAPILECDALSAICLAPDLPWQAHVLNCFHQIYSMESGRCEGFEMRMRGLLSDAWLAIALNTRDIIAEAKKRPSPAVSLGESRARLMTAYIQAHYSENITINDIAAAANISRSECFRTFHSVIKQKPVEYLTECRISHAQRLLRETAISVTDIATACGFNHTSYFCRIFREKCGVSPSDFRNQEDMIYPSRHMIGEDSDIGS